MSGAPPAIPPPAIPSTMSPSRQSTATIAWFHCFAGIAGDMALGSLVDAGADADEVRGLLGRLDLPGWDLRFEDALRGGVACTRAIVSGDDVVVRTHGAVASLIAEAALPRIFVDIGETSANLVVEGVVELKPMRPGALGEPEGQNIVGRHRRPCEADMPNARKANDALRQAWDRGVRRRSAGWKPALSGPVSA